jgi:cell division protein FtsN
MARDHAKTSATRYPRQSAATPTSSRPAFISGLIVGALCMHFVPALLEPSASDTITETETEHQSKLSVLKFDFYTLLKDSEIIVPDGSQPNESKSQPETDYIYLLQAGSFTNPRDAESLRIQLLLFHLTANIETFELNSGATVNRVLVGPFASRAKTASAKTKLAENNINSILLKRKL